jgi:hypothetical protein
MVKNWQNHILEEMNALLTANVPDIARESRKSWYVRKDNNKHCVVINFGKLASIPEFSISYPIVDARDEWGSTSPNARLKKTYMPDWTKTRKLALASEDTINIRDKTNKIYWLFSGRRDWNYVTNKEQLGIVCTEFLPDAVTTYIEYIHSG